jgi:hypothetical protein
MGFPQKDVRLVEVGRLRLKGLTEPGEHTQAQKLLFLGVLAWYEVVETRRFCTSDEMNWSTFLGGLEDFQV